MAACPPTSDWEGGCGTHGFMVVNVEGVTSGAGAASTSAAAAAAAAAARQHTAGTGGGAVGDLTGRSHNVRLQRKLLHNV